MTGLEMLQKDVSDILARQGVDDLLPVQTLALQNGILDNQSMIVLAPTSSGKTLLGELVAVHKAMSRERTAILVPFKALAEERFNDLNSRWTELGLQVALSTGDYPALELDLLESGEVDVVLFTYERFLTYVTQNNSFISSLFSTVVVDEMQLISDKSRGAKLEWILTFLRRLNNPPQIIGLSAVAKQLNGIDTWLSALPIITDSRPAPLIELVGLPDGSFQGILREAETISDFMEQSSGYIKGNPDSRVLSFIKNEFTKDQSQQILVFRNTVDQTEETAQFLSKELRFLSSSNSTMESLSDLETTELSTILLRCLESSVAFHNSELTLDERRIIENGFRSGEIKCLVATATLAMGVNLPCNKVVMVELERPWADEKPYKVAEYRNMSGRAGRYGIADDCGRSYYLSNDPLESKHVFNHYIKGNLEPIESALIKERLDLMVLYCMSYLGRNANEESVAEVLLDTFAGSHRWNEQFKQIALKESISNIITLLHRGELIEPDEGGYILTGLGRICASSGFDLKSFVFLTRWIKETQAFSIIEFLSKIVSLPVLVEARFPKHWWRLQSSARTVVKLLEPQLTDADVIAIRLIANLKKSYIDKDLGHQARMVAAIFAFTQGIGIGEIERSLLVRSGTLKNLMESIQWIIEISINVLEYYDKAFIDDLNKFLDSAKYGVPELGRDLARLDVFRRTQVLKLLDGGICDPIKFLETPDDNIAELLYRGNQNKATATRENVIKSLGPILPTYQSQIQKAEEALVPLIHQIYGSRGGELERPVLRLLNKVAPDLKVVRIRNQKAGEADYTFLTRDGQRGIIQLASKADPNKAVALTKAGQVLQQSPELHPDVFVCIAFPKFDRMAQLKADAHGENFNYKAICLPDLLELCLNVSNGNSDADRIYELFESGKGLININNYL